MGQFKLVERPADVGGHEAEQGARAVVEHADRAARLDHHLGDRRRVKRDVVHVGMAGHGGGPGLVVAHWHQSVEPVGRIVAAQLPEDAAAKIDRSEHLGPRQQHLRFAEHQDPVIGQRRMKTRQDARLDLGVEVHQRVAAEDQAHARDRRVVNEIVPAEDHRAPQILVQHETVAVGPEIFLQQRGGHRLDLPVRVDRLPRLIQRLIVDVGRVDLDTLGERVRAERFRDQHRNRV